MSLSRPFPTALPRWIVLLAILAIAAPELHAQRLHSGIFQRAEREVKSRPGIQSTARTISLDVDVRAFQKIDATAIRLSNVPLSADLTVGLDLREFSVLAPDAIVTVTTANGVVPAPMPTVRMFRGTVAGEPNSQAYLAISNKGVVGSITRADGTYEIATDYGVRNSGGMVAALVYPFQDATLQRGSCGVSETLIDRSMAFIGEKQLEELKRPHIASSSNPDIVQFAVKGAFESDYELLANRFNNDQVATLDFILGTIGRVSNTYEHEVSTQIVVGYLNIWATTSNGYPYTEAGNMQIAVQQLKSHWGTKATPARGFMQLLSGKDWKSTGILGIVNDINPMCNVGEAYSVALTEPDYHTAAYVTVSHELGHLFGAYHTHNCRMWNGQLDHCFFPEQGTCFNEVKDTIGTIMSYCSTIVPSYSPVIANFLKNANTARFNSGSSCIIPSKKLTILQTVILFPKTDVGQPVDTVVRDFFQNNGVTPLTITEFTFRGINTAEFQVIEPTLPFTIPAGERKNLKIRYKATQEGAQAVMTIKHDAYDREYKVTLEAYAIAQVAILNYRRIPDRAVNFGETKVGLEDFKGFSYLNVGTALLHITAAEIVGPDRLDFRLTGEAPPFSLAQGDTAVGGIEFVPRSQGTKQAWLRVESNSTTGAVDSIPLTASVRSGPLLEMRLEGQMIDFGEVNMVDQYDTTIVACFNNVGSDIMTLNAFSSGVDQLEFYSSAPVIELEPGQSEDLVVGFKANPEKGNGWRRAFISVYVDELAKYDTIQLIAHVGPLSNAPGTGEDTDERFVVSPNPSNGNALVTITPTPAEIGRAYSVKITDVNGREVRSESGRFAVDPIGVQLRRGDLPSGVYYISVTTESGTRTRSATITP